MLPVPELSVVLTGLVAGAALFDVASGRIPNGVLVVIAALGVTARLAVAPSFAGLAAAIGGMAAGLAIWIGPFALRWVGAADVKLVAAIGAWLGPLATLRVSLYAGLAGGLLSIAYIVFGRQRVAWESLQVQLIHFGVARRFLPFSRPEEGEREQAKARRMPYAVAVFVGLVVELFLIGPQG